MEARLPLEEKVVDGNDGNGSKAEDKKKLPNKKRNRRTNRVKLQRRQEKTMMKE
jgi:hypothetical protein